MKKYLVHIERTSGFTGELVAGHREFLANLEELKLAGAFSDQSGGAYVIQANSLDEAISIVKKDPMNHENETIYTIKEWNVSISK